MSVIEFNSIIKLDSVDSTNNYATRRLVSEHWSEGTAVVAEEQSSGKGQMKNKWESEKGKNLLVSVVLYPNFLAVYDQFEISKVIALAVHEVVSSFVTGAKIKWPNDIYVGDKKISGILIENAILGNEICWVVAGVGLNVNQTEFRSDAPNPVSLSQLSGCRYDIDNLLGQFLTSVDKWYSLLKTKSFELIDNSFINNLYRYDEEFQFQDKEGVFKGKIKGVNRLGQLIIEKQEGLFNEYSFKEVTYL